MPRLEVLWFGLGTFWRLELEEDTEDFEFASVLNAFVVDLRKPAAEGALEEDELPESEATLARRVLIGMRDWEFRFDVGEINGEGASCVGDMMVMVFPAELARGALE